MVDMTDEDLDELASLMTFCRYDNGDAIVTKGDPADGLYQIHSGGAVVEVQESVASEMQIVHRYEAGGYFGELAMISETETTRRATVRASERGTQCLRLDVVDFQSLQAYQTILLQRAEKIPPKQRERIARRIARQKKRQATLAAMLFAALDTSRDGTLGLSEMQELAQRTGGTLSRGQYAQICEMVNADAEVGITGKNLLKIYVEFKLGNLEEDCRTMGLEFPQAEMSDDSEGEDDEEAEAEAAAAEEGTPPEPEPEQQPAEEMAAVELEVARERERELEVENEALGAALEEQKETAAAAGALTAAEQQELAALREQRQAEKQALVAVEERHEKATTEAVVE